MKEGIQKSWYENGQISWEGNYYKGDNLSLQGKQDGIQKKWHENGQIWYEENYTKGKLNSLKIWKSGKIIKRIKYV